MNPQMSVSKTALAAFSGEQGIRRLVIFASALQDEFGLENDIDLRIAEDLRYYFRQDVLETAEVQYAIGGHYLHS